MAIKSVMVIDEKKKLINKILLTDNWPILESLTLTAILQWK